MLLRRRRRFTLPHLAKLYKMFNLCYVLDVDTQFTELYSS
jgi:hypothetical protein